MPGRFALWMNSHWREASVSTGGTAFIDKAIKEEAS